MRARIDDLSFASPQGLDDRSDYRFFASEPALEFRLGFEFPAGEGTPAEVIIAELHAQLERKPAPDFALDAPSDRELAGQPGKLLRYAFTEEGRDARTHCGMVAANLGTPPTNPGDYVLATWMLALPEPEADAWIDAVLASLAPADQPSPAPPQPGWIRRSAGAWAFDLPDHLAVPRARRWIDLPANLSVSIEVLEPGRDAPGFDDLLDGVADDGLTIVAREDLELSGLALDAGQLLRLRLHDPDADEELSSTRAILTGERGDPAERRSVRIDASGPWDAAPKLRALVDALLASVREEGPA